MDSVVLERPRRTAHLTPELSGVLMVLLSATAFGALPILAKFGYAAGLVLDQMLALRFLIAAIGMTVLVAASGQSPARIGRRRVLGLLMLGAIGFWGQSFTFFAALRSLPASLTELVLYTYPAVVALSGSVLFKRAIPRRHWLAMLGSFFGLAMLVGDVRLELTPDMAFAIATPIVYGLYIVAAEYLMRGTPAMLASTVVVYGTALSWSATAIIGGHFALPSNPEAWMVLGVLAVAPSMLAIPLFLAALPRIGGDRAALFSIWEPVFAIVLAFILLGERLGAAQIIGGAIVLAALCALQLVGSRQK